MTGIEEMLDYHEENMRRHRAWQRRQWAREDWMQRHKIAVRIAVASGCALLIACSVLIGSVLGDFLIRVAACR